MNVALSSAKPQAAAPAASRALLAVTLVLAVVTAVAAAAYLVLALQWRQQPFLGVMVSRSLAVDGSYSLAETPWPGLSAGLQRRDHIVSINGQALAAAPDAFDEALYNFHSAVPRLSPDDTVTVGFSRPPGGEACPTPADGDGLCSVTYALRPFSTVDFIGFFLAPFITGLACFGIGIVVLWLRPNQATAVLAGAACLLLALVLCGLFDVNTSHALVPLWIAAITLLAAVTITLALVFPVHAALLYGRGWLIYLPLGVGLLAAAALVWLVIAPPAPAFQAGTPAFALVFGALITFSLSLLYHRRRASSLAVRDQSTTVLIGLALSGVPVLIWVVNTVAQVIDGAALVPFNVSVGTPFAILTPLSLAYAVLQYRIFDTDRVISQGITYGLMLLALVVGYFLLVFSASLFVTQGELAANNPLFVGLTVFLIALLFLPVRSFIQTRIDRLYYRQRINFQRHVDDFTHEIARSRDINRVIARLGEILNETLQPETAFVFVLQNQTGAFTAAGAPRPATDIQFAADTGIVTALDASDQILHLEPRQPWPLAVRSESARLRILNTRLIAGLRGSAATTGFVCLGPPRAGSRSYSYEHVLFVQNLVSQMAIAVERVQVVEALERRVNEQNVLTQVSQAANFKLDFDDLLELTSTQASRLIDAPFFYIVLADSSDLFFAFFLENDERERERENQRWPLGRDLFSEVVRTNQGLLLDDYASALAQRALTDTLISPHVRAWMGVPLATNTQMIGMMAVGSDQPGKPYSEGQLQFFKDIAQLAATSIEKTRLFEETNQRARQLAALNEVSSALAGELNLDKLLELVTHSAVNILNAEAGSLLLRAEDSSSELEFKIAVGSAGQDLVGSRFSVRQGLAGEVVSTGRSIIVNDAMTDRRWAGEQSRSDFATRTVLAVPLTAKGQTIGVLEILNKQHDQRFDDEDARLLSTFAVQAAVAIENVRLFSLTDAQLNARVSELETLEQVDTELNRTLDLNQVADIAIRWAMNITRAPAAALGLVAASPPRLEIVAAVGYGDDDYPVGAEGRLWPLTGAFARVLRQRRGDMVSSSSMDFVPCLRGSTSQIILPMVAGGDVNGLLIVETNRAPQLTLVHLAQLYRLSDHAGIALANAQLYAELTRANDSKSEFVSFVAHELKTPMTSIKGYTELLLLSGGGQLEPQQETFLRTIRANIERMNTLVSDLNDVTKMETNNLHMELRAVSFANVLTETLRPLQRQIEDRQQTLEINLPADLPALYGDQNRLIQVLTNLLSNAHKYTPAGGRIAITGEVVPNRWNASQRAEPVCHVMVRDTGIGMSPEDVNRLFTPYFRSENPLAREQSGTGLGLTIVRGIIERHNGRIWVESEIGQGTVFHFTVPLAPSAEAAPTTGD